MQYLIIDLEIQPNKVMLGILNAENGKHTILDGVDEIKKALTPCYNDMNIKWISFNGMKYDLPMLENILYGNQNPYEYSQLLIKTDSQKPSWIKNSVDLMVMIPSIQRCSLKELGHRLGYHTLANLPYDYDKRVTDEEWEEIKAYNLHDLNITKLLWENLKGDYEARLALGESFGFHAFYSGSPRLAERAMLKSITGNICDNDILVRPDLPLSKDSQERFNAIYEAIEV